MLLRLLHRDAAERPTMAEAHKLLAAVAEGLPLPAAAPVAAKSGTRLLLLRRQVPRRVIAVVAGAGIVQMEHTPLVDAVRPLIAATVVIFWVFCLWLIPLLIGAGIWRHALHRVPLRYVPTLWSMVFPMGMFAVASLSLGEADALPAAGTVGGVALVVAVIVWAVVLLGTLHQVLNVLWATLRRRATARRLTR